MNRSTSRSALSSRRRGHVVAGLLTAVTIALAGQGTAAAAEQPAQSRTATETVAAHGTGNETAHGTGNGAASAAGLGGLLHLLGGLLPDVTLPKNNNDWQ
ncbi:hypothetical protein PYK79_35050 [Streptomyces sp. ID05-04B]|uniref:hypothetical protein n=1 Tax=unclassified Streptomyces TaxID=2593676 RepID=UPI000D1A836C|nr:MULTISPECIES: hypothetical protein [unclassified Streptomyces]AVV41586.1 hypothetical protein C6376_09210 [Streptomyces sp. P3]MDX5567460.1 hypothetical protein [Streptomyces sp. ID05-04B]